MKNANRTLKLTPVIKNVHNREMIHHTATCTCAYVHVRIVDGEWKGKKVERGTYLIVATRVCVALELGYFGQVLKQNDCNGAWYGARCMGYVTWWCMDV